MTLSQSDAAFLEAARDRLSDEDWRSVLALAQILSDRIFQPEFKAPMLALLDAFLRLGTQIVFQHQSVRDRFHRLYETDGVIRLTLHKPPEGGSFITGITFEGKAFEESPQPKLPRRGGQWRAD